MHLIKSPKNPNRAIIVSETEDDWEFIRYMWNDRVIRDRLGLHTHVTITSLNDKLEDVVKVVNMLKKDYGIKEVMSYTFMSKPSNLQEKEG